MIHFCLLDAHAPAGVLKLWYRELYDPLIPDSFYEESIKADDPKDVLAIVDRLPEINRNVSGAENIYGDLFKCNVLITSLHRC